MPTIDPRVKRIEDSNRKLMTTNRQLKTDIVTLQKQNKEIANRLRAKEKELSTKTVLRQNPFVKEILAAEKTKFTADISKKNVEIKRLKDDLLKLKEHYAHLETIKPVQKDAFNKFLSSSIVELQNELSATESEYEFIVRDLEIETNLLVESREVRRGTIKERKLVYILPTITQLNEIDPGMLHKLKYSLSVVPKE